MSERNEFQFKSVFRKLHSYPKLIFCIILALLIFFIVPVQKVTFLTHVMIGWDVFSLSMILLDWTTFSVTGFHQIREQARVQDSSRTIVFSIILIATTASFLAVLLILVSRHQAGFTETFELFVAVAGMMLSWFLIHTIFTIRYAHIYYGDATDKPETHAGGLQFPGGKNPDYFDFAYFSFVLGMTFQVSDVVITSKRFRIMAMWHGLLSFGFDTIMIALTINLIAGLSN
jgi:uncharacterized membrane protein